LYCFQKWEGGYLYTINRNTKQPQYEVAFKKKKLNPGVDAGIFSFYNDYSFYKLDDVYFSSIATGQ